MANSNRASGLSPSRYLNGTRWSGGGNVYCIPSTDLVAYAVGDPVTLTGDADTRGVACVAIATGGAGNPVLGPIVSGAGASIYGSDYGVPAESPIVIPAAKSRNYYVLVCDDPYVLHEVQEDSIGNNLAAADVGSNLDLVAGANNGYLSGWLLDSSTVNVGSTRQVKLIGLQQRIDNAIGQYGKWLVLINNHPYKAGVAGV